jgi:glycosyltransferase involved in cell wall biosynthesis
VRLAAAPVVITEHTGPFARALASPPLAGLTREALARAARVVAVSENLRRQMRAAGIEREIGLLANPISEEFVHAPPAAPERTPQGLPLYHAFFIGRLEPAKGVRELGRAARLLSGSRDFAIHWHVVGRGPERAALAAELEAAARPARVSWYGLVPRAEIVRLMRLCHVFVLPSHGENCPLSVEEALATGRPVVGTLETGTAALVGREDGVLCRIGDAEGLAAAIASVLRDYGRWDFAAISARARERFSPRALAESYAAEFRAALEARPS